MNIIFLLIPVSLILVAIIMWAFFWAIRSGQFDDMQGPANSLLMDDDAPKPKTNETKDTIQDPDVNK